MSESVPKKEIQWQRKTYPLKLKVSEEQKERFDSFLNEYSKVTNFVITKCVNELFPGIKKISFDEKHPLEIKKCNLCGKQKKIRLIAKLPNGKNTKNCGCLIGHYSLRKLFLPSKNYSITQFGSIPDWDMRLSGKLYDGFPKMVSGGDNLSGEEYNRSIYDSCLQKAVETIKSQVELNNKIDYNINFLFKKNVAIQRLLSGVPRDAEHKKEMDFFSKFQKKKLKKFLSQNKEKLRRLKNQKAEKVFFRGNMARIYNSGYSWVEKEPKNFFVSLNIFSKPILLDFFGNDYQKKKAIQFFSQEKQPEIELLKRKENYYIQYIYRQPLTAPAPDDSFTAVGIDIGILNHFVSACWKKDSEKPFKIRFFSGRPMRRKRRQFYKIRRIWQHKTKTKENGGKGRSLNWFKKKVHSQNEERYVKTELHKATTALVRWVFSCIEKPVIVLEDLVDIRDETKKFKRSHLLFLKKRLIGTTRKWYLKERYLNKELNNWNFKMMQDFIKYKAAWFGIPVVIVSAKDTSIKCNKCGNTDEKNYSDFHQLKFVCSKCGYQCNADFNAAVNLAKSFFSTPNPVLSKSQPH